MNIPIAVNIQHIYSLHTTHTPSSSTDFDALKAFNFSLLLTGYQLAGGSQSTTQRLGYDKPQYDLKEEFDPSLQTLNTVSKLVAFCDGLYTEKASTNSSIKIDEIYPCHY